MPRDLESPAQREATQVVTERELLPQRRVSTTLLGQTISKEARLPFLCEGGISSLELTSCVTLLKFLNLSEPVSLFKIRG